MTNNTIGLHAKELKDITSQIHATRTISISAMIATVVKKYLPFLLFIFKPICKIVSLFTRTNKVQNKWDVPCLSSPKVLLGDLDTVSKIASASLEKCCFAFEGKQGHTLKTVLNLCIKLNSRLFKLDMTPQAEKLQSAIQAFDDAHDNHKAQHTEQIFSICKSILKSTCFDEENLAWFITQTANLGHLHVLVSELEVLTPSTRNVYDNATFSVSYQNASLALDTKIVSVNSISSFDHVDSAIQHVASQKEQALKRELYATEKRMLEKEIKARMATMLGEIKPLDNNEIAFADNIQKSAQQSKADFHKAALSVFLYTRCTKLFNLFTTQEPSQAAIKNTIENLIEVLGSLKNISITPAAHKQFYDEINIEWHSWLENTKDRLDTAIEDEEENRLHITYQDEYNDIYGLPKQTPGHKTKQLIATRISSLKEMSIDSTLFSNVFAFVLSHQRQKSSVSSLSEAIPSIPFLIM